tara:strand:- start:361 stop:732 length:372 start_codon:yes stop_codon:yes gene_type:complete
MKTELDETSKRTVHQSSQNSDASIFEPVVIAAVLSMAVFVFLPASTRDANLLGLLLNYVTTDSRVLIAFCALALSIPVCLVSCSATLLVALLVRRFTEFKVVRFAVGTLAGMLIGPAAAILFY